MQKPSVRISSLAYENGQYAIDDEIVSDEELINKIIDSLGILVIMEYVECGQATKTIEPGNANYLKLIVYNKYGDNPKVGQAYLSINASKQYSNHEFFLCRRHYLYG